METFWVLLKLSFILSLLSLIFSFLNLLFDSIAKRKNDIIGFVAIEFLALIFFSVWIFLKPAPFSWEVIANLLLFLFGFSILWGLSYASYKFGIENGRKYWRNHTDKFYAYGIGILGALIIPLVFFLFANRRSNSDEYDYAYQDYQGISFSEITKMIPVCFLFLIIPYCIGVYIQNSRQMLHANTANKDIEKILSTLDSAKILIEGIEGESSETKQIKLEIARSLINNAIQAQITFEAKNDDKKT
jgi:hypothetical protein